MLNLSRSILVVVASSFAALGAFAAENPAQCSANVFEGERFVETVDFESSLAGRGETYFSGTVQGLAVVGYSDPGNLTIRATELESDEIYCHIMKPVQNAGDAIEIEYSGFRITMGCQ